MAEYLKPMLDVGSPRVLNCNVITRRLQAKDPAAVTFFRCKPLNNLVLIKDTDMNARSKEAISSIGTKLYLPFNENDIYEGGRTIFVHDKMMEGALIDSFGRGALPEAQLAEDIRIMKVLDRLPSLDPFLLKDVFINEKIDINPGYFEVGKEIWDQIELYILQGFEPLAKAAFPDAMSSDEVARKLIEKIWEGRDLEALKPLIMAFRLPAGQELEIFAAWKGINFYGFTHQRAMAQLGEMLQWLREIKIPTGAVSAQERKEITAQLETVKAQINAEWQSAEKTLGEYQASYDKMFKLRQGSADFLNFLRNSSKAYWTLGNALGKTGHATYCWDSMTKRYPGRKMPWDQTRELITLFSKIFHTEKKAASAVGW
ncbi:MAG: hypothetical protein P4M15_10660 [Alphaproteobacteria bacterium]|nr:hypothetical protein [Alphaproteobacteria bacterium]